jgi:hypothetical protein
MSLGQSQSCILTPNRHSFRTDLPCSLMFAFYSWLKYVIGRSGARVDVLASAQAIGWQLMAIHVELWDCFMTWNREERAHEKKSIVKKLVRSDGC